METNQQIVEQFLFEQLEKIAPGKYSLANVLQQFKTKLRFPCNHLKSGRGIATGYKDYNFSVFKFPTGITEIKCLYGCGLKVRSDEKGLKQEYQQLLDLPTTNSVAAAELTIPAGGINPGPVPTYTDEYREQVQERERGVWEWAKTNPEEYWKRYINISWNHPDPIEAPESAVERQIKMTLAKNKVTKRITGVKAVCQDPIGIPALIPVKKIREASKTQSRKRGKK